jgi:hypothetical protein
MESFTALTNLYVRSSAHQLAQSALPNAPVLPYREPRRRIRQLYSAIRHPVGRASSAVARRPVVDRRPARYSPEC